MKFFKFKSEIIFSWLSFGLKFIGFGVLLPMIFVNYTVFEINIWLLIMSISTITGFIDLGIAPNFTRILSYFNLVENKTLYLNYDSITKRYIQTSNNNEFSITFQNVCFVLNKSYHFLGYFTIFLISIIYLFYLFFSNSINFHDFNTNLCFFSLTIGSFYMVKTGEFTILMMAKQEVIKLRKIEFITSLVTLTLTFFIYFIFHPPLFLIILFSNLQFVLIYYLLKIENRTIVKTYSQNSIHVLKNILRNSIFTSIGIFLSQTILLGTGLYLSFFENVTTSASINFTLRIFVLISTFSNFFYYNKLPFLASIYIDNNIQKLFKIGSSLIFKTLLTFSICTILLIFFGNNVLIFIKSKVQLLDRKLLYYFYIIFICERFGALNIQMFSLSNIIKIHYTNGGTFIIIFFSLLLLNFYSIENYFIYSLMIGYCFFYLPISFYLLLSHYSKSINKFYFKIYSLIIFFILFFSIFIYV